LENGVQDFIFEGEMHMVAATNTELFLSVTTKELLAKTADGATYGFYFSGALSAEMRPEAKRNWTAGLLRVARNLQKVSKRLEAATLKLQEEHKKQSVASRMAVGRTRRTRAGNGATSNRGDVGGRPAESCQQASNFDQQPAPNIDQGLRGYLRFLNR
jgi:hypothetical protein